MLKTRTYDVAFVLMLILNFLVVSCCSSPSNSKPDELQAESDELKEIDALSTGLYYPHLVKSLTLTGRDLEAIPQSITKFRNLELLNVSHNNLSYIPEWLFEMTHLELLIIDQNNLSWNYVDSLRNDHPKLISSYFPRYFMCQSFRECREYKGPDGLDVILESDKNVNMQLDSIAQLSNIIRIDFIMTDLDSVPGQIGDFIDLWWFDFESDGAPLTDLPKEMEKLVNLRMISLIDHDFTVIPKSILNLPKLEFLCMWKNEIDSVDQGIGRLTNLEVLQLDNNQITYIPPDIGELTKLTHLSLVNNRLRSLPTEIDKLKNLEELYLHENLFDIREQDRIRELLPNAKVYFD
ncbi:leucine-rich repeat domain-containing protein [Crocinitomix catalasitica]|nr:leucine-rich repeat domain-containing protein [Crocinitomix catalasitica]